MALPSTKDTLSARFSNLMAEARYLKQAAADARTAMAAGPVSANAVLGLCQRLQASKTLLTAAAASAPLQAYARDQLGNGTLDLAAEIGGVTAAIDNVIGWVVANFPASGGYILKDTLNADGSVSVRSFSAAATAGLRTQLQSLENSIGA